jgi:hypothetical protein
MPQFFCHGFLTTVLWAAIGSQFTMGVEPAPWADPALDVREGLVVWLDATVQNDARKHQGELPLADEDPLAVWHDSSGNDRHLRQEEEISQPRMHRALGMALEQTLSASHPSTDGRHQPRIDEQMERDVGGSLRSRHGLAGLAEHAVCFLPGADGRFELARPVGGLREEGEPGR